MKCSSLSFSSLNAINIVIVNCVHDNDKYLDLSWVYFYLLLLLLFSFVLSCLLVHVVWGYFLSKYQALYLQNYLNNLKPRMVIFPLEKIYICFFQVPGSPSTLEMPGDSSTLKFNLNWFQGFRCLKLSGFIKRACSGPPLLLGCSLSGSLAKLRRRSEPSLTLSPLKLSKIPLNLLSSWLLSLLSVNNGPKSWTHLPEPLA